jgi:hypothetical protein
MRVFSNFVKEKEARMDSTVLAAMITAIVAAIAALIGYSFTYWNNLQLSRQTARLNRINQQLSEFYGPLYSLVDANTQAWDAFRTKYRPGVSYFQDSPPLTEEDLKAWRMWITTVFMPRNLQLYKIIASKTDLIVEPNMPECLSAFCAHVAAYEVVLKMWEGHDFSEHEGIIRYPGDTLTNYSRQSFKELKKQQAELLGQEMKSMKSRIPDNRI